MLLRCAFPVHVSCIACVSCHETKCQKTNPKTTCWLRNTPFLVKSRNERHPLQLLLRTGSIAPSIGVHEGSREWKTRHDPLSFPNKRRESGAKR